jgi:phage tail sheath protein FI
MTATAAREGVPPRAAPLNTHRTPGVLLEWLDAAPQSRTLIRTDIAGFAGIAERGPLHQPTRVDSWEQFRGVFGDHLTTAYLAYAVEGFFVNGGKRCWVVRVADPAAAKPATAVLADKAGHAALTLTASSPGTWGNRLTYQVQRSGSGSFTLVLRLGEVTERWRNLSADSLAVLNDPNGGSRLVTASGGGLPVPATETPLAAGDDGLAKLTPEHFLDDGKQWGVSTLDTVDEIALVVVPDLWDRPPPPRDRPKPRPVDCSTPVCAMPSALDDGTPVARKKFTDDEIADVQASVLQGCERRGDRVALLDTPPHQPASPTDALNWRDRFDSAFGAIYHPWLLVVDPLSTRADVTQVPPSGHVAGICARVDTLVGVHKPPANEVVEQAVDTAAAVDEAEHGDLNEGGVNAIRAQRGIRVLGDRTLTKTLPEWWYLNVRRLVLALEEQIVEETAWTVFEPNSPSLWIEVDRVVRGVLEEAWRRGMLVGAAREQAYSVRCDESVNPPSEVASGRLTCLIGLNPPPPAEFVVLRVVRTPTGVSVVDDSGGGHG